MATVMLDRQCRSALHCSGSAPGTPFTTNLSVLYNRAASDNARCRLGQQREGCSRVLDVAMWPVIRNSDVTHEPGSTDRLAMQPVQDRSSHGTLTLASQQLNRAYTILNRLHFYDFYCVSLYFLLRFIVLFTYSNLPVCLYVCMSLCVCVWAMLPDSNKMMMMMICMIHKKAW